MLSRVSEKGFSYYTQLGRVREYVESNYSDQISLKKAARVAAMEVSYFSSFFHEKVGICFRDWLHQIRIGHAMEKMKEKDYTITYVAYEVGFGNLRTFQRVFKKYTGKTPRQFKKQIQANL